MNPFWRRRAFVAVRIAVGVAAAAQPTPIEAQSRSLEERLQRALTDIVTTQGLPGATAAVSIDGKVITVAAGLADREHNTPMTPAHRMLVGSSTKPFFAYVVLAVAAEGKLDLDAPVSKWLNDKPWFSRLPNSGAITLRHLLTHRSGIPNHVGDSSFAAAIRGAPAEKLQRGFTVEEQIAYTLDRPPPFAAGAGFLYTDTGYLIAALVLERATGHRYFQELDKRVLKPLGLRATEPSVRSDLKRLPQGYRVEPAPLPKGGYDAWGLPKRMVTNGRLAINPVYEWTGGGLISTSADLARWMESLFEDHPHAANAMITRPAADAQYGLGIFIRDTENGPLYSHPGGFPGYRTEVAYSPELGVGVAYQANVSGPIGSSPIAALLAVVRAGK